eukprot:5474258-Amphidinium_carterae.1
MLGRVRIVLLQVCGGVCQALHVYCSVLHGTRFAPSCCIARERCSSTSWPGTVMWLMAVAYSLIQRHHSICRHLLHKGDAGGNVEVVLYQFTVWIVALGFAP